MRHFLALLFALPPCAFGAATRVEGYSEQGFLGREGVVAQFTRVRAGWSDPLGFLYLHMGQDWASSSTSPTQPAGSFAYAGPGLRFGNGIASLALEARQLWRYAPAASGSNDWDARAVGFRDQTYEAHHFAVDAPDYIPPHLETYFIKFKIDAAPEAGPPLPVGLRGTFTSGGKFSQFKAERFEGYPAFPQNDPDGAMDSISGVYEATDAKALLTQFTVTQVGQRIAGQMCFLNQTACVPLTFGHFDPGRNVVYATSGELAGGRWVQARAQLREKGKIAEVAYLIGGRGLHTTMKMRLVDTPKIPEVK